MALHRPQAAHGLKALMQIRHAVNGSTRKIIFIIGVAALNPVAVFFVRLFEVGPVACYRKRRQVVLSAMWGCKARPDIKRELACIPQRIDVFRVGARTVANSTHKVLMEIPQLASFTNIGNV